MEYGIIRYPITDLEKTIVDCFDQPQYSRGYLELIKVMKQVNIDSKKLLAYCRAMKNVAVTKRIGFLAELFEASNLKLFIAFARTQVNSKYNLLDPRGPEEGEFVAEWKLRLNISRRELITVSNNLHH